MADDWVPPVSEMEEREGGCCGAGPTHAVVDAEESRPSERAVGHQAEGNVLFFSFLLFFICLFSKVSQIKFSNPK
jgi:hypothetical protein